MKIDEHSTSMILYACEDVQRMVTTEKKHPATGHDLLVAWKPSPSPRVTRRASRATVAHDACHGFGPAALPRGGAATHEAYGPGVDEEPRPCGVPVTTGAGAGEPFGVRGSSFRIEKG